MRLLRIILILFCLISISNLTYGETNFCLFGRGNFIKSSGSESDYQEGENDFPLMSSHQTFGFGVGITQRIEGMFFGLEAHYNLSGKTTLTDPSDNDTVEISTYKNVVAFLTIRFNIMRSRFMTSFINGGAGVNFPFGTETKTYTSQFGYDTIIERPEKKYPVTGFGGIGFEMELSPSISLLLSGRYLYIALDEPQSMFVILTGINFRL